MDSINPVGLVWSTCADDPMFRKHAFRPADPLADHVVASLAFLKRVASVKLTAGDKKMFEFTVKLNADPDDPESKPSTFTITRTADEIDRTSKTVQDACCRHFDLRKYSVPPCQLCEPFKEKVELPVKMADRLLHSEHGIQKIFEERVVKLVEGSIVPPTNEKLFCEGVTRFPPAVTKFLLAGVDQTKL